MTKLWEKGYALDEEVEDFTVGNDHLLDQSLRIYDCVGSFAHASMLKKIGILEEDEWLSLGKELKDIYDDVDFKILKEEEDIHTAIENRLIDQLGEVGKKIHTARSRNDQVALDLRLYMKHSLQMTLVGIHKLAQSLLYFAKNGEKIPIPGRTHMQLAMPSSFGLWGGCYLESLVDDISMLIDGYNLIDQCPLGSASSYGVSLPIDREFTANLLGFAKVQNNVLYANQSRGKFEAAVVHILSQIMNDLSRMASDLIFFSLPEVGYLSLDESLCSGSSLMPQKRNPCALELVRAKAAFVTSALQQLFEITRPLPCGYHRDLQETKEPLLKSFAITQGALSVLSKVVEKLTINKGRCASEFTPEVFATDHVLKLVSCGTSFREAYKLVAKAPNDVGGIDPLENILNKKHQGATGQLNLTLSTQQIEKSESWLAVEKNKWKEVISHLFKERK